MRALAAAVAAVLLLGALRPALAGAHRAALQAFADAVNRGDAVGAAGLFAPAGVYRGVLVCDPAACVGRGAIAEALALEVSDRTDHRLLAEDRGELRCDSLASLADRVVYDAALEEGPDGIASLVLTPDAADEQTGRVLATVGGVRHLLEDWAASGADGPLTLPLPTE